MCHLLSPSWLGAAELPGPSVVAPSGGPPVALGLGRGGGQDPIAPGPLSQEPMLWAAKATPHAWLLPSLPLAQLASSPGPRWRRPSYRSSLRLARFLLLNSPRLQSTR